MRDGWLVRRRLEALVDEVEDEQLDDVALRLGLEDGVQRRGDVGSERGGNSLALAVPLELHDRLVPVAEPAGVRVPRRDDLWRRRDLFEQLQAGQRQLAMAEVAVLAQVDDQTQMAQDTVLKRGVRSIRHRRPPLPRLRLDDGPHQIQVRLLQVKRLDHDLDTAQDAQHEGRVRRCAAEGRRILVDGADKGGDDLFVEQPLHDAGKGVEAHVRGQVRRRHGHVNGNVALVAQDDQVLVEGRQTRQGELEAAQAHCPELSRVNQVQGFLRQDLEDKVDVGVHPGDPDAAAQVFGECESVVQPPGTLERSEEGGQKLDKGIRLFKTAADFVQRGLHVTLGCQRLAEIGGPLRHPAVGLEGVCRPRINVSPQRLVLGHLLPRHQGLEHIKDAGAEPRGQRAIGKLKQRVDQPQLLVEQHPLADHFALGGQLGDEAHVALQHQRRLGLRLGEIGAGLAGALHRVRLDSRLPLPDLVGEVLELLEDLGPSQRLGALHLAG